MVNRKIFRIIPAILTNNPKIFERRLQIASQFSRSVQIDILDKKFTPFTSVAPKDILQRWAKKLFIEIHLMIQQPEKQLDYYRKIGAQRIIPHYSALRQPSAYLKQTGASIALNPNTPISAISPFINQLDTLLLLAVPPGQSGQMFFPQTLEKIRQARRLSARINIEVDGGVNLENIRAIYQAGADAVICGSAIFHHQTEKDNFEKLRREVESGN